MAAEMGTGDGTLNSRGCRDLTSTLVRLAPGATIEQARAEVGAVAKRLAAAYPDTNRGVEATVVPVWAGQLGAQGMLIKPLAILTAVSVLLLLIVCANVANLLLSRAISRQKELAIRVAHGASRSRVVRQLLTETLLLALAGGALGLLLVGWTGQSLDLLLPPLDFPIEIGGGLSGPTVAFTLLVVVVATVASGLAPALLSVRGDLSRTLNEGGRGGIGGPRSHRLRKLLVGVEVGLAVVAVVGALLFLRSFRNATRIEPGFDTRNVVVSQFYLSNAGYSAAGAVGLLPHAARAHGGRAGRRRRDLLRRRAAHLARLEPGEPGHRRRIRSRAGRADVASPRHGAAGLLPVHGDPAARGPRVHRARRGRGACRVDRQRDLRPPLLRREEPDRANGRRRGGDDRRARQGQQVRHADRGAEALLLPARSGSSSRPG